MAESSTKASIESENVSNDVFWMFRISFMYYSFIGCLVTVLIAYPVSYFTGGMPDLDERYITPLFQSKRYREQKLKYETSFTELQKMVIDEKFEITEEQNNCE